MASVTKRISMIKQPENGYISKYLFDKQQYNDNEELNEFEIVGGSVIGTVVDYLTRFSLGEPVEIAFLTPVLGAYHLENSSLKAYIPKYCNNAVNRANSYLKEIKGLDDNSIFYACKLIEFNVWAKTMIGGLGALLHLSNYEPDEETIKNIRILTNRSVAFFKINGPIIRSGFTFEPPNKSIADKIKFQNEHNCNFGGYTPTVDNGEGDFLTKDTMWDLKVYKRSTLRQDVRLQIIMYWIMGQHSKQDIYKDIKKVGIYNPRQNVSYTLDVSKIPSTIIKTIEDKIICYNERIPTKYEYDPICDLQFKLPD